MKKTFKFFACLIVFLSLLFFALNYFYKFELKPTNYNVIYDKNGKVLYGIKNIPYDSISKFDKNFADLILQIEDKNFYNHFGVDFWGMGRAIWNDLKHKAFVQGGSTIDQQVIKLNDKAYKRGIYQKFKEIFWAVNINFHYSKDDIYLFYINNLEFFNGIVGVNSACKFYFGKECKDLFLSEKLFIISIYQTGKNPLEKDNFNFIKNRSSKLCHSLAGENLSINFDLCSQINDLPPENYNKIQFQSNNLIPHYYDYIKNISNISGSQYIFDYNLKTKIDSIISNTYSYRKNKGVNDCCVLVLDRKGQIISMNVCRDWNDLFAGQVNGCLSKRQTGSAIKPFVYIYAMKKLGLNKDSILQDKYTEYILDGENTYAPKNFDFKYHGDVSLAYALGSSLNIPAVNVLSKAGVADFLIFLTGLRLYISGEEKKDVDEDHKFFNADNLGLSTALGTYELSPLQFAKLWTIFLESDNLSLLFGDKKLLDDKQLQKQKIILKYKSQIDEVYDILSTNQNRILSFGLDNFLDIQGWAVKSGTSRHFVDGWTCGVSREKGLVVCVWAGNYNGGAMTGPGVQTAGYIWNFVVNDVLSK